MSDLYILDEIGQPVRCDSVTVWGRWFEKNKGVRRVAFTQPAKGVEVSTVFLGMDHAFGGGAPLLFETMVFGGPLDGEQDRYTTRAEAEAGHAAMVKRVLGAPSDIRVKE